MKHQLDATKTLLVDAALPHVAFDGWSQGTFRTAVREADVDTNLAQRLCPRGAVDLAVHFHRMGDEAMAHRILAEDMSGLRYSEKVATAIWWRLEAISDAEAVRRAATLFALPLYSADGARLIWGTADRIWEALGDTSDDVNWYSKRATLSAVYGSAVLYWLGDESPGFQATKDFIDRRISDVMRIEKAKASVRKNPVLSRLLERSSTVLPRIKAPGAARRVDLPGHRSDTFPR